MDALASWSFWLTALAIVATPGTGALYTVAAGIGRGWRAGLWAAFASTLGILPHMVAALTGLAAVLHASALLFDMVRWAGVAYLLFMAWGLFREAGAGLPVSGQGPKTLRRVLLDGITLNLLNPKLSIFFVAFLPQFLPSGSARPVGDMLALSLAFMALTFAVFALYGCAAGVSRAALLARPRLLSRLRYGLAAAFGMLAVHLAVAARR
ncbi:LysE family translocator [Azorhizobium sp. AG788]|uniref:LysE family translocator n=1 Tax=Azorhizobium sp. AG788 TaxID=2183897 RepID=UPI00313A435F